MSNRNGKSNQFYKQILNRFSIDYSKLKAKIKQLKSKHLGTKESTEKVEMMNEFTHSNYQNKDEQDTLDHILRSSIGKLVDEFLKLLNDEIKKLALFYKQLEKDICSLICERLKNDYTTFNLKDITSEILHISNLIDKVFDLSKFLNLNITAIRKILKKFDKNFSQNMAPIALHYLRKMLSDSNSYLVYILEFKVRRK